ncbi:unnamed protein product [Alternaria alternata]
MSLKPICILNTLPSIPAVTNANADNGGTPSPVDSNQWTRLMLLFPSSSQRHLNHDDDDDDNNNHSTAAKTK